MTDVSPVDRQVERAAANEPAEQRGEFFGKFLQEVLGSLHLNGMGSGAPDTARDVVPNFAISNADSTPNANRVSLETQQNAPAFNPNAFSGDIGRQQSAYDQNSYRGDQSQYAPNADPNSYRAEQQQYAPNPDPYSYGGDRPQDAPNPNPYSYPGDPIPDPYSYGGDKQPSPPQNNPPDAHPDKNPPAPDAPKPQGDQQVKMGDRMFTVHPDGSAEYNVAKGDCVWFVATDVLKARTGHAPNDAQIVGEVNAIAKASGLTEHGRNPNLIYPNDKLVIPSVSNK